MATSTTKKTTEIRDRGAVKRLAKKGVLYARTRYRYTDDYRDDLASNFGKGEEFFPVVILEEGETRPDSPCFVLWAWQLRGRGGSVNNNGDGTATLYLHSNHAIDLEVREAAAK